MTESILPDDLLEDLADLSDSSEKPYKKPKLSESISLSSSILLSSGEFHSTLSQLNSSNPPSDKSFESTCNELLLSIDSELTLLHKSLKDLFFPILPELEDIVESVQDYTKAVKILSTTTFTTKDLEKHLGSVTTIAVATALIKTPIKQIEEDLLNKIEELTKEISELLIGKAKVLDFVQRKIRAKAPNLCNLLSEAVAANLLSAAGSLEALSIMPACNIQVLGLVREGLPGSSSLNKFKSFLSYSPFVIRAGQHRKKAVRMIAGKAALAARVDRFQQSTNGDMGLQLLQQLQTSFEKSLEVDLNQLKKPLPVPSEFKKSKRGGKRIRAAKKRFEISEIRKDLNRVEFGVEAQEEFRDTGFTFGMLGKSGKLKTSSKKSKPFKTQSKPSPGTLSCFAFMQGEGVSLENPEKFQDSKSKFFESTTGFTTVQNNKK